MARDNNDLLGKFLEDAHHNAKATCVNLPAEYKLLSNIDELFYKVISRLGQASELIAGFFLFRMHSSFRAAADLCLAGQVAEAYAILRGCLENALYGLYVAGNEDRQKVWLRRHNNEASLRRVRNEFTIANVLNNLRSIDTAMHETARALYERTIDLGGHPNERATSTQVEICSPTNQDIHVRAE